MRPISDMPLSVAKALRVVFTDIDDTITTDGRLPAVAYQALEELRDAGLEVVPVTGRPAGWCDMIARMWPVRGVVGENGALYFTYVANRRAMIRVYANDPATRATNRTRLDAIRARVLNEVPGCAVAADQPYRENDLAIDFAEDVSPLGHAARQRIKAIFEEEGATAMISSIHVNGWYGAHNKLQMSLRFVREVLDLDPHTHKERFVFCGDSPNDAPMFAYFPHACAVANVRAFEDQLEAKPCWVAAQEGALGFVEIAARLLQGRRG